VQKQLDLLQGTLDMLILKAVSLGPLHGYGILLRIEQVSKERLEIQQGSLYPALYRLEHQGWITSEWGASENNRKAKYYRLTADGKRRLQAETENWNRMAEVIAGILSTRPGEIPLLPAVYPASSPTTGRLPILPPLAISGSGEVSSDRPPDAR
jgi:PadR family transcriptional regulator, regulatory protein PadR